MRKLTRFGIIILVIGISLLLVTVLRNSSSTSIGKGGGTVSPDSWELQSIFLLGPRDLRLTIQANSTIDVYVLDGSGINLWKSKEVLSPLWKFTGVKQETFTVPIMTRGDYAVLIHNIQNSSTATDITLSMHGLERDLLWASIALTMVGPVISVVNRLVSQKQSKNNHTIK